MTYSATASTTDFDSVSLGSNPSRSTKLYGKISSFGRAFPCDGKGDRIEADILPKRV